TRSSRTSTSSRTGSSRARPVASEPGHGSTYLSGRPLVSCGFRMDEHVAFLNEQVDRHHAWFSKSLPMIASENVISPMAREMLLTDFGDRYAEGLPHERYYQG